MYYYVDKWVNGAGISHSFYGLWIYHPTEKGYMGMGDGGGQ